MYLGGRACWVLNYSGLLHAWILSARFFSNLPVVFVKPPRSALRTVGIFGGGDCGLIIAGGRSNDTVMRR